MPEMAEAFEDELLTCVGVAAGTVYWHHFAHHCHFTHPWGSSLSIYLMTSKLFYVVIDYYILKYEFSGRNLTSGISRGLCANLRIGNDGVKQLLLRQLHFLDRYFCSCNMFKMKALSFGMDLIFIAWEMAQSLDYRICVRPASTVCLIAQPHIHHFAHLYYQVLGMKYEVMNCEALPEHTQTSADWQWS